MTFRRFDVSRCVVLLACVGGCTTGGSDQVASGPGQACTSHKGPVQVTLTVTPTILDFSQCAEVRLEIISEPDVTVNIHDYARAIRDSEHHFEIGVVGSEGTPPMPTDDGRLVSTHRFELRFFLPGEYELPPARLTFVDQRNRTHPMKPESETAEPPIQELQTGPLTITARDESARQLSPEELRTIRTLAPIELPGVWSRRWWLGLPIVAVVVVAALFLMPFPRRLLAQWLGARRAEKAIAILAHEWAGRQLAALIAEDLVERGLFREFHYRISSVLRGYIERRYGVSAGEMTTEEFLEEAAPDRRFGPETTAELRRFLSACDLVKYARHEPTRTESNGVLAAAETLVERTRERGPEHAARSANRSTIAEGPA